jgi:hypothetical protein
MAQDSGVRMTLVNAVMNLPVTQELFSVDESVLTSREGLYSMQLVLYSKFQNNTKHFYF